MKQTIAIALFVSAGAWASDVTPLDVKTGQWEYTVTVQLGGAGAEAMAKQMPPIPPEQLAKLSPDQRAKMEALLKQYRAMASGQPTTTTHKTCIKKEDLLKLDPASNADKTCKMTVLSSSRSKQEIKEECSPNGNKQSGTMTIEAQNSESVKFSFTGTQMDEGRPINMNVNGTGKWLSSTCTEK